MLFHDLDIHGQQLAPLLHIYIKRETERCRERESEREVYIYRET